MFMTVALLLWLMTMNKQVFLRVESLGSERFQTQDSQNLDPRSYLFRGSIVDNNMEGNAGTNFMVRLMRAIHANQHPDKYLCTKKRLLVLTMSTSLEGTGSIMRDLMIGLSIAMHSNRILVWGLDMPMMSELTREVWERQTDSFIKVHNWSLDCRGHDVYAGAFSCFFEPLSSCSVADLSLDEVEQFSRNGYNESARVMLVEVRKGAAVYHPPKGLFNSIFDAMDLSASQQNMIHSKKSHFFAAATAAYAFRLKEDIYEAFSKRKDSYFPKERPIFGLHVRHGDLKGEKGNYAYKSIFEFDDFFAGARDLSQLKQISPKNLFVATDSVHADNLTGIFEGFLNQQRIFTEVVQIVDSSSVLEVDPDDGYVRDVNDDDFRSENDGDEYWEYDDYDEEEEEEEEEEDRSLLPRKPQLSPSADSLRKADKGSSKDSNAAQPAAQLTHLGMPSGDGNNGNKYLPRFSAWYQNAVPSIHGLNNTWRYRTAHGSHTVAADGACVTNPVLYKQGLGICAISKESMDLYRDLDSHKVVPRSMRLMRVLLESIEDLYSLSLCDALVAQGSSYYSTFAGMLIFARTAVADLQHTVLFLDDEATAAGVVPTAYLPYTHDVDPKKNLVVDGAERWIDNVNIFVSGLQQAQTRGKTVVSVPFDPWSPEMRMKMVNGLPRLPDEVFYREAAIWLGTSTKPVWPGHCPAKLKRGEDITAYVFECINLGVEHYEISHPVQALQCWHNAMRVIRMAEEKKNMGHTLAEAKNIATDNINSLMLSKYDRLVKFYKQNANPKDKALPDHSKHQDDDDDDED